MSDCLYIVVPAYNEAENIEKLIADWYPVIEEHDGGGTSRLVVIDDGSKDDTYSLLEEQAAERPYLTALTKPNGGHGPTVIYGYRYALEQGADYVFQTDADGQTLPAEFEAFWNVRHRYDAVLGNRTNRQDGKSRAMVEKVLVTLLRVIFGVRVPDANAPFRLMKRELLETYLPQLPEDYNLPNVMLTTFFAYYKEKIAFKKITFRPRGGGVNSINMKKIIRIGWKAMGDFARFRREMRKVQ